MEPDFEELEPRPRSAQDRAYDKLMRIAGFVAIAVIVAALRFWMAQ